MAQLPQVARQIGADERTLRRAVRSGAVRCHRPGPRRAEFGPEELQYLAGHWGLLSELRRALRTEPRVRLAVLYGSAARGDDGPDSDLDLLVVLDDRRPMACAALGLRLRRRLGREVDVALLDRVEQREPLLLLAAMDEGRVTVDRDQLWPQLRRRRRAIARRAEASFAEQMIATATAARELVEG